MMLGAIADDFTGATDLANNLARAGMRTIVTVGVPGPEQVVSADAVVVALKSRTVPATQAVAQSLEACRWLRARDARQIYFKVCSTFDSTPRGNIGPVTEALMDELNCAFTVATPAFPDNERTVFRGHLFVGNELLSDSGMRNHPLTPMTDANLLRFLQAQLNPQAGRRVGLIDYRITGRSAEAIRDRIRKLESQGVSIAIADAINNDDLARLAEALQHAPLVTASSGLGVALPGVWGFLASEKSSQLPKGHGGAAILSGSCSVATNAQVRHFIGKGGKSFALTAIDALNQVEKALSWTDACWRDDPRQPLLLYSTAEPGAMEMVHARLGAEEAGARIEEAFAKIVQGLVARGAGRLIVAGGETSGVCVHALDIRQLQIGPQIDPGVPWCYAESPLGTRGGLHTALKSGNFGREDFFTRAFSLLT
jgi:3-dehydrotetronate 4-kinase